MAEIQNYTNLNISDIPESLRPFRNMLLSAATGLTFDPRYIASNFNGSAAGSGASGGGGGGGDSATDIGARYALNTNRSSGQGQQISDADINALIGALSQGPPPAALGIDKIKGSGDGRPGVDPEVQTPGIGLVDVGSPIGYGNSPYPQNQTVGGGAGPVQWIGPGGWGQRYDPITFQFPKLNNSGIGPVPGADAGGVVGGVSGAGGQPASQPGAFVATLPASGNAGMGTLPGAIAGLPAGSQYNPSQYAGPGLAQQIANALGATVAHTSTEGPNAPPGQNVLDFGIPGTGNVLNAGLVADMLSNPSQQPFAAQRLRDELAYLNHTSPFYQRMFGGGSIPNIHLKLARKKSAALRYDTGGLLNMPGADGVMSPYQAYGGQRTLDWTNPNDPVQSGQPLGLSQATRTAESGYMGVPSMFDSNGGINAGRDANGAATSNFGIANDQMDWAGNKIGDAISGYGSIFDRAGTLASNYAPGSFSTFTISNPTLMSAGRITVDPLNNYQMVGPDQVTASSIDTGSMGLPRFAGQAGSDPSKISMWTDRGISNAYMDPYTRSVTDVARQRAIDDFNEQRGARTSAAVAAGAFGGSRAAIQEGLAQRALNRQLQAIDAQGNERAYLTGQQQFNADRNAGLGMNLESARLIGNMGQFNANQNLQAQLANQGARQAAAKSNLDAALQTQGLATQAGLSAAQSNQSTNAQQFGQVLNANQEAERMRNSYGLQAQQMADASSQAAQRFALDSAQLGGNLGLQAMQGMTNAGTALTNTGASRADLQRAAQQLELQRLGAIAGIGTQQDARRQADLNLSYQDFMNQKNDPYQKLNWYSGLLSGTPMGYNQEAIQYQNYSPVSQYGGLAASLVGGLGNIFANRK